jgi:hypothetical protein
MIRIFADKVDGQYETGSFSLLRYAGKDMVMVEKFVGMTVKEYEKNFYDDSDFYAVCWDEEKQTFVDVLYATTRGWTYSCGCEVDASEELLAKYKEFLKAKEKEEQEKIKEFNSSIPTIGTMVRSTTKRGKAFGKSGVVTGVFNSFYTQDKSIRFECEGQTMYLDCAKLEVLVNDVWVKAATFSQANQAWK